MSYKTILAHFPSDKQLDRTLDTALPLVRANDAHFIGLHVIPRVPAMYGLMAAELPQSIIAQQEEVLARQADQLKGRFIARCEKAGVKAEWRCNKVHFDDVTTDIVGELTLRGVTRPVTATVEARVSDGRIGIVGSIPVVFTDFDIVDPSLPGIVVEPDGLVEFVLVLTPA